MSKNPSLFDLTDHRLFLPLSGADIVALMRRTGVTIRKLAEANDLPMTRVRALRASGVQAGFPSWEIFKMVEAAK